jgi:hypothetical protein
VVEAVAPPDNSFDPTLAGGALINKSAGFYYPACHAPASGGLVRALGGRVAAHREVEGRL